MSREKLLSTLDELEHITESLSKKKLNKIVKMQNLSLNKLKPTDRMNSLSLDELKQVAITRHIKNYKDMSKEDLLIALLKSNKGNIELLNNKSNNIEIRKTKKLFNKLNNKFSEDEINEIKEKTNKKECIYNY